MMAKRLVVFDMDGTLIRNTDSVSLLCKIRGIKKALLDEINHKEDAGEMTWIEADYERAKLIKGLDLQALDREFEKEVTMIAGLMSLLDRLERDNCKTVLMTAGPKQVAQLVANKYSFDYYFGSDYEVMDGMFTEKIINHMGSAGKMDCLNNICRELNLGFEDCIAVGDSLSDLDLFNNVGFSIALNPSKGIEKYASVAVITENILDISEHITSYFELQVI